MKRNVDVIEYARKNSSQSSQKTAEVFKCGCTQIHGVLKKEEAILSEYKTNAPASRKPQCGMQFNDINEAIYAQEVLIGKIMQCAS